MDGSGESVRCVRDIPKQIATRPSVVIGKAEDESLPLSSAFLD
jgi:hypothetical protein